MMITFKRLARPPLLLRKTRTIELSGSCWSGLFSEAVRVDARPGDSLRVYQASIN